MRWTGDGRDEHRYAPLLPAKDEPIPCFIDNMPVFWNHKWYFIGNCEEEEKEESEWQQLKEAGNKPQNFTN